MAAPGAGGGSQRVGGVGYASGAHGADRQAWRAIAHRYGRGDANADIVLVGRDIGTVVVPDAPLKLYIDATPEEHARRRHHELRKQGKSIPYDQVLADMIRTRPHRQRRRAGAAAPGGRCRAHRQQPPKRRRDVGAGGGGVAGE